MWVWISWAAVVAVVILVFAAQGAQRDDCDQRGGTLLRGETGMECVKVRVLSQ